MDQFGFSVGSTKRIFLQKNMIFIKLHENSFILIDFQILVLFCDQTQNSIISIIFLLYNIILFTKLYYFNRILGLVAKQYQNYIIQFY